MLKVPLIPRCSNQRNERDPDKNRRGHSNGGWREVHVSWAEVKGGIVALIRRG